MEAAPIYMGLILVHAPQAILVQIVKMVCKRTIFDYVLLLIYATILKAVSEHINIRNNSSKKTVIGA